MEKQMEYLTRSRFGRHLLGNKNWQSPEDAMKNFPIYEINPKIACELAKDFADIIGESYISIIGLTDSAIREMKVFTEMPKIRNEETEGHCDGSWNISTILCYASMGNRPFMYDEDRVSGKIYTLETVFELKKPDGSMFNINGAEGLYSKVFRLTPKDD